MEIQKIPVIEAGGSNYNIGFTIGKRLKKQIKKLVETKKGNYQSKSGKSLLHYAKKINQAADISKKYFPEYVEELLGMAEGAEIDFHILFALGCEDEFIYNCTSIAGFSEEGIILGHNEDWLKDRIDSLYICRINQKNKPFSISLSYAGHLAGFSAGLNSKSCAYACNSISAKRTNKKGLPWQFLLRAYLDASKYSDLIRIASLKNKMIGGNSLMIFKNSIFDFELLPRKYALIKGKKYLAHTNHILNDKIKSEEKCHKKDSIWRLERANELLGKNKFNFSLVRKILSDHKRRPFSICCHEFEEKGKKPPYSTIASIIIKVDKKEFYVVHGNPCGARYQRYCL